MKLSKALETYEYSTAKSSEITRQLAFAGIAVVWIFAVQLEGSKRLPPDMVWPTLCFVFSLGLDLLHAIFSSVIWGTFHRCKEKEIERERDNKEEAEKEIEKANNTKVDDPEVNAPPFLNWPLIVLFGSKIVAVIIGYVMLLMFLKGMLING